MATAPVPKKDHWSSTTYNASASFVPQLTTKVLQYLSPQPNDKILDIGCGDGLLTQQIATQLNPDAGGNIHGLDSSRSFIATAQQTHAAPNCTYALQDCADLGSCPSLKANHYDKVFSNAALHWILRAPSVRKPVFQHLHTTLKPDGLLVFEMGGAGNVAEVQAAFLAALVAENLSLEAAREAAPWFFPSVEWMRGVLEEVGFEVRVCELEYRPTRLTDRVEGEGGLEGWVRLMGAGFLEAVEGLEGRERVVRRVCGILETVVGREDGSAWLGYVRLRVVARKK